MAAKDLPDPELLRKLLRYEPETGKLFWRERPREMFSDERCGKTWNTRYAGKESFTANSSDGYRSGSVLSKPYLAHRIIWAIVHDEWPPEQIDHINGNRMDNRIENLRAVSHAENAKNQRPTRNNAAGVMGVQWAKREKAWRARIWTDGANKHLGYFGCIGAAAMARCIAERKHGFHPNHGR